MCGYSEKEFSVNAFQKIGEDRERGGKEAGGDGWRKAEWGEGGGEKVEWGGRRIGGEKEGRTGREEDWRRDEGWSREGWRA